MYGEILHERVLAGLTAIDWEPYDDEHRRLHT